MSGADRYQEAYQCLAEAAKIPANYDETNPAADRALAEAQIQATLALAAATVLPLVVQYMGDTQAITDWARMIAPDVSPVGRIRAGRPMRYEPAVDTEGDELWLDLAGWLRWLKPGDPAPEGWRRLYVEVRPDGEPT